jgi:hypothetical protein
MLLKFVDESYPQSYLEFPEGGRLLIPGDFRDNRFYGKKERKQHKEIEEQSSIDILKANLARTDLLLKEEETILMLLLCD